MQVLQELHNFFGPELKDVKENDDILTRVDGLVLPFEEITFNPFNSFEKSSWQKMMQDFDSKVKVGLKCT